MKKLLAIFLALVTVLSVALVSCDNGGTTNNNDDPSNDTNEYFVPMPDDSDSGVSGENSGSGTSTGVSQEEWKTVSYSVYPVTDMNIRKSPSISNTVATKEVKQSTELKAVAVKSDKNGNALWYKLDYNGEEYYAAADYVSENIGDTKFSDLTEALTITVKDNTSDEDPYKVNLREYPSFGIGVKTTTVKKENTDVTPIKALKKSESGTWYYVEYNGKNYYLAVTSVTKPVLNGLPGGSTGNLPG